MQTAKLTILLVFCWTLGWSQGMYDRKKREVFPDEMQYHMNGWYLGPGATYMASLSGQKETADNEMEVTLNPSGRPGLFFEFGRYNILRYWYFFKYMDYGIAYKSLRGKESYSYDTGGGSEGKYGDHFFSAHLNFNNVIGLSDYSYIQNTFGINVDYAFMRNISAPAPIPGLEMNDPGQLIAQLHYKLGYGFKASKNLIIIPALETPIWTGWPFEVYRSASGYFHTRHRPIIFSVRFLFLREKRLRSCKPVDNPDLPGGSVIPDGMER